MRLSIVGVLACACVCTISSRVVLAQEAPTVVPSTSPSPTVPAVSVEVTQRAVFHYERGRAYYAAGRYRAAITELEMASHLDPTGFNLSYDLGLVYERVGDVESAIGAYRHYVNHVQDPIERERAERIIARLEGARVELTDLHPHYGRADGWFWLTAVLGVGALAGGAAMFVLAASDTPSSAAVSGEQVAGGVSLAAGGALIATAAVLFFARRDEPRLLPRCVTAGIDLHGGPSVLVRFP